MRSAARVFRLDRGTWRWLDSDASLAGAGLVVLGAFLVLAFDRFGWPDFAVRATTRTVLVGFYGWMWLALASWAAARLATSVRAPLSDYVRLTGHAHFPLLIVAVLVMVFPVTLNIGGFAIWPAIFSGAFWMPAMLASAVAVLSQVELRRAALLVLPPYLVWVAVVGRFVWQGIVHLL